MKIDYLTCICLILVLLCLQGCMSTSPVKYDRHTVVYNYVPPDRSHDLKAQRKQSCALLVNGYPVGVFGLNLGTSGVVECTPLVRAGDNVIEVVGVSLDTGVVTKLKRLPGQFIFQSVNAAVQPVLTQELLQAESVLSLKGHIPTVAEKPMWWKGAEVVSAESAQKAYGQLVQILRSKDHQQMMELQNFGLRESAYYYGSRYEKMYSDQHAVFKKQFDLGVELFSQGWKDLRTVSIGTVCYVFRDGFDSEGSVLPIAEIGDTKLNYIKLANYGDELVFVR